MSNRKRLPNEILCEIFKKLRIQDLVECQLVCKNWRKYASLILYRELGFRKRFQVENFIKCMQNSSLRSLVQEIAFWCPDYDEKIISLIFKLAETCPNVQKFKGTLHIRHWNALGGAVGSYWKQLKQLPEPQWSMNSDLNVFTNYYTLASVCHSTLACIVLPPVPPYRSQFKTIFPLLPFFINLTHLIANSDYRSSTLMDYDEVIQQCPNLMCFTLDPNLNIIDGDYGDTKRYDVFSMQPYLKLRKLVVERDLHQDTFDYIIHKFPNLECCNVHLSVNEELLSRIEPWITSHYEEKLRKFLEYLSSRKCNWLFTYASFPLIEEYLQHTTNSIVRISSTGQHSPWLHMQQDNIFWIIRYTTASIDRLKELFKRYQNGIREAYLDMPEGCGESPLIEVLLSEFKGLEKFTYKKNVMCLSQTNFPGIKQILSPSLTALKLTTKHLQPEVLSAYSYAFPELRNVTIEATYKFGNPLSFVVDMPITEFNHLKIHLDIDSSNPREKALDKPVLLK